MTSLQQKIFKRIKRRGRGSKVYSNKDFIDLDCRVNVNRALSMLFKFGSIRSVGRGLYDWSLIGSFSTKKGKELSPDMWSVIDAIKKKYNINVFQSGISSANALGLTNAVPVQPVFLTDGPSRIIETLGVYVRLNHAGKKILPWFNRPAFHVVNAIFWFGKEITKSDEFLLKINNVITPEIMCDLKNGRLMLPGWVNRIVDKINTKEIYCDEKNIKT